MNQHQRKFLLEAIEKQHRTELEQLKARKPQEPSLNNYLIASVLDGSFKLQDPDSIRTEIRERVRNLGKADALVAGRSRWDKADDETTVTLPVGTLFKLPPDYLVALDKFTEANTKWDAEYQDLEAAIGAMRIKVQIGSDKSLEALVEQADKLCSMSLTKTSHLLTDKR